MSKLRIKDAPLLPNVNGAEKIPTGGRGDYAVSIEQIKTFAQGGVPQQVDDHINDTSNPHQVTKGQVGLGNVDNTSDVDKPISTATQEALALKSNQSTTYTKTEVDSQINLKADKLYVDSQDSLKADKTYVDEALSSLNTQATKFYPTLSEANADIANIEVNQPVQVGEAANGGLWYKATTGATSLTKSPYDPLTQAKDYVSNTGEASIVGTSQTSINYNTSDKTLNLTGAIYVFSGTTIYTLSTPQSIELPNFSPYRLEYVIDSNTLIAKPFSQAKSVGNLVVGFVTATSTMLKTVDFMYAVDGVAIDALELAKQYSDENKARFASVNIAANPVITEAISKYNTIAFFGTLTADTTVIFPKRTATYVLRNIATVGAFKVKVKTDGQTGTVLEIPARASRLVHNTGTDIFEVDSDKISADSPVFTGTPTAPTPSTSSNDGTLSTTKFVKDFVDEKFNKVANINIGSAVGDVVLSNAQLNSGILNIYGNPAEPVNLVFPDDTNKTYLIRISVNPSTVVNVKFSTRGGVARLVSGAYHLTVSSIGFILPYDKKANLDSPTLLGTPKAPTPSGSSRDTSIATTLFVGRIAQGVIVESITDDSTEVSNTSGHTICLTGTLTKDVTLTIKGANASDNIGINIVNMTDGGKSVFLRGIGQNSSVTFIELSNGEGKSIYTRVGVAYSLNSQSSSLPEPASKTSLGVVKIGSGINVDSSGTISVTGSGGGSGTNLSYSGKFKVGSDYQAGDVVDHGSGIYQVVSNVTNAQKPYDDVSFQKIAHNYQAGEKGSVTVLSNDYEVIGSSASRVVYMTKDGLLVFSIGAQTLRFSRDYGKSWESQAVLTLPSGSWTRWVMETSDGELLVGASELDGENPQKFKIYKSTGWDSVTALAPQWDVVFEIQRTGALVVDWGISIHNNYIVMAEYGSQKGRDSEDPEDYAKYAYLSKDHGKTWETIFNLDDHVTTLSVHMHGACFDPYWNRIWVSHGDGAYSATLGLGTNGLYYSDDLGKTWHSALQTSGAGNNFPQSVGIVALPTCILFSSDSSPNGVQRIDRAQGRIPHKGYYEVESAYYIPGQVEGRLTNILSTGKKAEWLPNAPYVWSFAAESTSGKTGCIVSWDGWEFHELWISEGDYSASTGVKHVVGVTPENTIIITGDGEGVGGNASVLWRRTLKVSLD